MTPKQVAIIDYGMGNLRSVQNAVGQVGGTPAIVSNPAELQQYHSIILPGVGAFGRAIQCLRETGLADALNDRKEAGAHILGICLGMQLMCRVSEEDGLHEGLGWFDAKVMRFSTETGLPVPHIGWNGVDFARDAPICEGLTSGCDAYFVHSYHVVCENSEDVLATTEYGSPFHSMIQHGYVHGIQFHPEKSQELGLRLIQNYLTMSC